MTEIDCDGSNRKKETKYDQNERKCQSDSGSKAKNDDIQGICGVQEEIWGSSGSEVGEWEIAENPFSIENTWQDRKTIVIIEMRMGSSN